MNEYIVPAIIADNQEELTSMINKVKDIVDIIQLDFMDGDFVPNPSINFDFQLPKTNAKYEAHLMVSDPENWFKKHGHKVDIILIHKETIENPSNLIKEIKSQNKKAGLVLNPETPIEEIKPYLKDIDQVLFMTVNPGFYGSPFLPETLSKIEEMRKLEPNLNIEADGGIKDTNIEMVKKSGVNMFCSGSYIMKAENPEISINNLKNLIRTK